MSLGIATDGIGHAEGDCIAGFRITTGGDSHTEGDCIGDLGITIASNDIALDQM